MLVPTHAEARTLSRGAASVRRWGGNSDSNLSVEKVNANNLYKDRIRTWELQARIALNSR